MHERGTAPLPRCDPGTAGAGPPLPPGLDRLRGAQVQRVSRVRRDWWLEFRLLRPGLVRHWRGRLVLERARLTEGIYTDRARGGPELQPGLQLDRIASAPGQVILCGSLPGPRGPRPVRLTLSCARVRLGLGPAQLPSLLWPISARRAQR